LIIDKFLTKETERLNFDMCTIQKINEACFKDGIIAPEIKINHASSQSYCGLQMADFVAGSIFNKYERRNEEYYKIIRSKINVLEERF